MLSLLFPLLLPLLALLQLATHQAVKAVAIPSVSYSHMPVNTDMDIIRSRLFARALAPCSSVTQQPFHLRRPVNPAAYFATIAATASGSATAYVTTNADTANVTLPSKTAIISSRRLSTLPSPSSTSLCQIAASYTASLQPNGSWADINYHDRNRVTWQAATHWTRLLAMAQAMHCDVCPQANTGQHLDAIKNGLAFWLKEDP